jgi:heat shock protein HtpX
MYEENIDTRAWRQHAWLNRLQSAALLSFMGGYLALLGWLLAGAGGVAALLLAGTLAVAFNPGLSPRWVMRLYGATPIPPQAAPGLSALVGWLARRAGLDVVPTLYLVPSRMVNAFAVGRPAASAIGLTDGLLRGLDTRELAAVLAHEISHVRSNDLWVLGLADIFSRTTSLLALLGQLLLLVNLPLLLMAQAPINWFAIALLVAAPSLSALAQLALSRTREYDADLNAVRLTGDVEGMARALARIERLQGGWFERILLPGRGLPEPSLLRTHPQTDERIARLRALVAQTGSRHGPPPVRLERVDWLGEPVRRRPRWHVNGLWH